MADKMLSFPVSCAGGLDETSTTRELQSKPGFATHLYNFEITQDGGYRRVNGFEKLGTLGKTPDITVSEVLGARIHNNGYIICKAGDLYFTYDGDEFVQLNKIGATTAKTDIEMNALSVDTRTTQGFYNFERFALGTSSTLVAVCPGDNPVIMSVEGTQMDNTTFTFKEITISSGSLSGASHLVKYKDQLVISGMDTAPTEIYYSDILSPDDFEGANAGTIGFNDEVTGIKMFREILYVFCRNSIHKVSGLETGSPQRQAVTSQLGCVDGNSIQELAGDLVFLGPDGLRTLSATERISDINLSTMSDNVQGRLRRVVKEIDEYDTQSCVIRNKSQYRIFFKSTTLGSSRPPLSFVMFVGRGKQGEITTAFSELGGFDIAVIDAGYIGITETVISGDTKGNIYFHDKGSKQDGVEINFLYETPSFDLGDSATVKYIHKVITRIKPEGVADFNMSLVYDYRDPGSYSPPSYSITPVDAPPLYGTGTYGTTTYGLSRLPAIETLTEGSGKTVAIKIFPSGLECDPFSIQGFDLRFIPAGKL